MLRASNPFAALDKETVIEAFRTTGSRDPDVLYARRAALLASGRLPLACGAVLGAAGLGASLMLGPLVGGPVALVGAWSTWRGLRNAAAVREGYEEVAKTGF
jgi:hypothetical protein